MNKKKPGARLTLSTDALLLITSCSKVLEKGVQ